MMAIKSATSREGVKGSLIECPPGSRNGNGRDEPGHARLPL